MCNEYKNCYMYNPVHMYTIEWIPLSKHRFVPGMKSQSWQKFGLNATKQGAGTFY